MKNIFGLLCSVLLTLAASNVLAQQDAWDYTVQLTASTQATPPSITLKWKADTSAVSYTVYRRLLGDAPGWGKGTVLAKTASSYTDKTALPNTRYEYSVVEAAKKGTTSWNANGYITSGINVELPTQPGVVILLVDKTYAVPLKTEIDQWIADVRAEGWGVIRHDVLRKDSDTSIKSILAADQANDPDHVRSLFILGHVPVPYSGDIVPDGHTPGNGNHQGSWPADVYYGNFLGSWTDESTVDTTAFDPRGKNIIGDGKFDQDAITDLMSLEVGRVDLLNMTNFTLSDTALLRNYLNRDHAYRTGALVMPQRALINVNFGVFAYYDVPGEDAWRNFPTLVGTDSMVNFHAVSSASDWFGYLDTAKYVWAYGCGPGSYTTCGGVGTTPECAKSQTASTFFMVFGSFFGDWDSPNNFTRAPLAGSYGLESCWASRPFWYYHPLGLGETFGYCARITQNDGINGDYVQPCIDPSGIHLALMGDPTLRMKYLSAPPTALTASLDLNSSLKLTWTAPAIHVPGYNIYRAKSSSDTLIKLNSSPVTATNFTDAAPMNNSSIYVVRAVALTTTPSGSYYLESGGATKGVKLTLAGVANVAQANTTLSATRIGESLNINVSEVTSDNARLSIVDAAGREIAVLTNAPLSPGSYNYSVNTEAYASGVYFVRLVGSQGIKTAKLIVAH